MKEAALGGGKMHYVLIYDVADDYMERRGEFRADHLALATEAFNRGAIVLGGALMEPTDKTMIVFTTSEDAESFALADPYVANGLVKQWRIRKWNTVIGEGCQLPV
jgi:hypothetical protein